MEGLDFVETIALVARIEAIRLLLASCFKRFQIVSNGC